MFYLELTHYSINGPKSCFYVKNKDTGVGNMLFQIASSIAFCITPIQIKRFYAVKSFAKTYIIQVG